MHVQMHVHHHTTSVAPVSETSKPSAIGNPGLLSKAEKSTQAALFLGYFDNLVQMYNQPGQTADVQAHIQSILTAKVPGFTLGNIQKFTLWADNSGSSDLAERYNTISDRLLNSPETFQQKMKESAAEEGVNRSAAFKFLSSNQFDFSSANNDPTTMMLLAEFMGSLNNNPNDPDYQQYTNVLEKFMGQSDTGVSSSDVLEEYCSSYLQSSDRDATLFPTGLTGDAQGFAFFAGTFGPASQGDVHYSHFVDMVSHHIGDESVDTPENLQQEMASEQWLSSIWA